MALPMVEISTASASQISAGEAHLPEPSSNSPRANRSHINSSDAQTSRRRKFGKAGEKRWAPTNETALTRLIGFPRRTRKFFPVITPEKPLTARDGFKKLIRINGKWNLLDDVYSLLEPARLFKAKDTSRQWTNIPEAIQELRFSSTVMMELRSFVDLAIFMLDPFCTSKRSWPIWKKG